MILIDALYINNSGGKVLLDYLVTELEKSGKKIYYLLDKRVEAKVSPIKPANKVEYLKASLSARNRFYKKHRNDFSTVLCFGNLPPNIRISATVYTYFHQLLFLSLPETMGLKHRLVYRLKIMVLNHFKKNTDYWLVQSSLIKSTLITKYKLETTKVLEMPFYPPFPLTAISEKIPHTYLYVSNAAPHKNHERLIEAFTVFYKKHKCGTLTLTVSGEFPALLKLIEDKQKEGIPINNIGFVPREELQRLYAESEFLVFPSLAESFGLGLIEAIECGCKVIGADLPYTYAVCEPSLTFNPLDENSIFDALVLSLQENIKPSVAKVSNQINELITLLK